MALIDMVNRLAVNHNDRVRDAVTINAGVEAVSGRRIRIRAGTTTVTLQGRPLGHPSQRPVEGNNTEAVCKVFRSIGLTVGAAAGPKGAHFAGIHELDMACMNHMINLRPLCPPVTHAQPEYASFPGPHGDVKPLAGTTSLDAASPCAYINDL